MDEIYKLIHKVHDKAIPSANLIVEEAFKEVGLINTATTPEAVLLNFNNNLKSVFEHTLKVLERYEDEAYGQILKELCRQRTKKIIPLIRYSPNKEECQIQIDCIGDILEALSPDLWHIFLSRSQSRKARGGADFQHQIAKLLKLADVPFEQEEKKYRLDFMIPSSDAFKKDKTRTILLSAKRTLRERWREVVEELYNTRSPNVYLATAELSEDLSQKTIDQIKRYNVHLLVWDEVKLIKFGNEPMVLGFSDFAHKEIPTFRNYWSQASKNRVDTQK